MWIFALFRARVLSSNGVINTVWNTCVPCLTQVRRDSYMINYTPGWQMKHFISKTLTNTAASSFAKVRHTLWILDHKPGIYLGVHDKRLQPRLLLKIRACLKRASLIALFKRCAVDPMLSSSLHLTRIFDWSDKSCGSATSLPEKTFSPPCQAAAENPGDCRNADSLIREPRVMGDKRVPGMKPGPQPVTGWSRNEHELKWEFERLTIH